MSSQPWYVYPFIVLLGVTFGMVAAIIIFKWVGADFSAQEDIALVEQPTLAPTIHAAQVEAQNPTPTQDVTQDVSPTQSGQSGFTSAVRYELLLPDANDNQAYRDARSERHLDGNELRRELLRELDILDLETQSFYERIYLNAEGDYREGRYHKFIFDDPAGQDATILAMIRKLRRSSPTGFIHMRAYEVSYRDY